MCSRGINNRAETGDVSLARLNDPKTRLHHLIRRELTLGINTEQHGDNTGIVKELQA